PDDEADQHGDGRLEERQDGGAGGADAAQAVDEEVGREGAGQEASEEEEEERGALLALGGGRGGEGKEHEGGAGRGRARRAAERDPGGERLHREDERRVRERAREAEGGTEPEVITVLRPRPQEEHEPAERDQGRRGAPLHADALDARREQRDDQRRGAVRQ